MSAGGGFDPRPLVDPVDGAAVRAFARAARQAGAASGTFGSAASIVGIVIGAVFLLAFGGIFLSIFVGFFADMASSPGTNRGVFSLVAILPLLLIGGVFALIVVFAVRGHFRSQERWYRLAGFARANGMTFLSRLANPALPGMIFGAGSARESTDLVRGAEPRFVEFANYRYTTGSGKNKTTHRWGYVAVKLDVPLPHIVLDATSNNGLFGSNLPASFDKDQRLALEGDFDRFFSLYCPRGYETDALYLFTPDIMARFIDNAAAMDVEIVDDWLFLYAKRDFSTLDPATWAWLFSVVAALLDKLAQWARWRDERLRMDAAASGAAASMSEAGVVVGGSRAVPFVAPLDALRPPPGVAAPGRRLERRVPWVSIIVIGVFLLVWLLGQAGAFAGILGGLLGR